MPPPDRSRGGHCPICPPPFGRPCKRVSYFLRDDKGSRKKNLLRRKKLSMATKLEGGGKGRRGPHH